MIAFYQENREILYIIGQIMSLSGPVIGFFVFYSKTRKQILTAKLSLDISGQKDDIRDAYYEIGKLYYELYSDMPEE